MTSSRLVCSASILVLALLSPKGAFAQVSLRDSSIKLIFLDLEYQGLFPAADMASRSGYLNSIGMSLGYKGVKGWYTSAGGSFLWNEGANEVNMLDRFATTFNVVDTDGNPGIVKGIFDGYGDLLFPTFSMRGATAHLRVGKIFPKLRIAPKTQNPNSGVFVELGGQFIFHKVNIKVGTDLLPALGDDQIAGYERITFGGGITERIGYKFFGNNRWLSFTVAAFFSQNFTTEPYMRYDTGMKNTAIRYDFFNGFSVAWTMPFYKEAPDKVEKFYYLR